MVILHLRRQEQEDSVPFGSKKLSLVSTIGGRT
jgi:hypothetical protein